MEVKKRYHNMKSSTSSTKERIFDVSIDLFSKKGFSSVSIREIAREVGIRESSIYNHYPSKDAILDAIFAYFEKEMMKMRPPEAGNLDKITPDIFRERVDRTLNIIKTPKMEQIFRICSNEQFRDKRARMIILHNLIKEPHQFTENALQKMVESKLIKHIDPKILSVEFQYPIYSLFLEYLLSRCEGTPTDVVEEKISNHVEHFQNTIKR